MTEEQTGKRMNFKTWWLSSLLPWWGQTQQSTQQQTSGQQSTGGIFLPWISNNQNLINNNKVSVDNGFAQGIQEWKIQSNIVLPWINDKPKIENATMSPTTIEQQRRANIRAKNNSVDTKSANEQIEEERSWAGKVMWQIDNIVKTYWRAPVNNIKKRWVKAIFDSWLVEKAIDSQLKEAGISDSIRSTAKNVSKSVWEKVVLAYNQKINDEFRKIEEKNLDQHIKEKYDNESITNLLWQWDFAGASYKIARWMTENWQMIPEMWLTIALPPLWLTVMWTDVYIQENQWTFEDMMENGATYDEARNWAIVVWILNAWIELLMERFLWWVKRAWATAIRRLFLKNAQREVVKTATKKWITEIIWKWLWEWMKWSLVEWFEEVLQQIVWNAMVHTINPERDITEWVWEAFEGWFYNLFNAIWWGTNMINDVQQNKKIDMKSDIEALQYVMEWEQRKAQRMQSQKIQEAKQRMKEKFLKWELNPTMDNGYTPTPEQAQQRAREKEENEQFEDELRAEQNRENSRYQETEWENAWLSDTNDYSTDTTISKDYSHSDMVNTDSFFKTDENWQYIDFNWWKLYAWETVSDTESQWLKWKYNKSMFSWVESFSRNPIYEEYRQNFYDFLKSLSNRITKKTEKEVKLWKTKTWADMKLTRKQLRHIIKLHGAFSLNDFLETINNPTYSRLQKWGNIYSDWPFYIKQRPNSDKFYYLWFKKNTDWSYNINTFYEITKSDAEWLLNRKLQNSDYQKYQLKYEEEWYRPWVADKNEKDISGKEWINLRNKFTKETVKQLAEKYWIKVEVIEWMIKILERWARDGKSYAYWKYLDQLLTLSEQIKESTAPHELLHAIFDMIDPETKTYLISQVMKSEWRTAEQSEEWLADSFSNFFRTGKIESAPKSTRWKIKIFFKRVRSFINGMNKWRNELEEIFTDIIESNGIEELQWKIDSNKKLQQAKEKMRKRFMEYEKKAEQIKSQKTRDEKLQRVYHGSPYSFEKFDSSNMWKWEWNQAHGWGHYVAVNKKTWEHYAEMWEWTQFRNRRLSVYNGLEDDIAIQVVERLDEWYAFHDAINSVKNNLQMDIDEFSEYKGQEDRVKEFKKQMELLDEMKEEDFTEWKKNLYQVEIPDPIKADTPTGSNYLEEWATLKKSEINKLKKAYKEIKWEELDMLSSYRDKHIDWVDVYRSLEQALNSNKEASKFLEAIWYNWIHYFWWVDWEAYVIFNDNDLEIKNHEKYQKVEYEYDEDGNRKWIKFEEDNGEFDPSIFWEPSREEQIADDKENEKSSPFYNAWIRYNNQNYKDDQLTFDEFIKWISERGEKEQAEYDKKLSDIAEAQNDPKMLDLQLRAVKLMEEEWNVGKKFWKNVSKEVRDRQQKEVETKREQLVKDIYERMYPWLKFEEATYEHQKEADQKEADWEMLGREDIENKLKYFKKDKNWNREAKEIKIDNPQVKLDKILSAGKFDEIFTPLDRVIEWKTPQWQHGVIDNQKNPKQYKSVMEKINAWKTKTKVTLRDVTRDYRALEKHRADQEAEKARKKKQRDEAYAKKKQEEYRKIVRMKAFQRLVDMQRFEKYPFLSEEEIKNRYGFTDEERKKITEQEEIKLPKRRWEKAIKDLNKAVDSEVRSLIEWLNRQNNMKQRDAEKELGEIWDIDIDVLLGRDEEKWQKEVEEFERLAKEKWEKDVKTEEWKTEFEKEMNRKTRRQKEQAEKLTKQWNEMFRKAEEKRNERYASKEEKQIEEVKTVEEANNLTKGSRWKRAKQRVKDTTIQDLIQPISSRVEKISPRVYLEMMRFEQRVATKSNIRMKQVEDFVKTMSKVRSENKKEYLNLTLHLLNGNVWTANKILEKYGWSIPRQVLDEIWADAEDVWYTMNYEWFYYPRKVKDVKEFLDRFGKTENKDVQWEIDKIVRKAKEKVEKRGEVFTIQQQADLINQLLMDGEVEWITLWSWHMKNRKIDNITKDMLEFYEDPVDALLQYISWMTEAVEKARFLWQWTQWEIKSLWEYISEQWIQWREADELNELLKSRFNYAPMSKWIAWLKTVANIIHLWSPSSALSQLADVSFSLIENWLGNLVQWLSRKYNLDLDALWITNRWEELKKQWKNESTFDKIQRATFKMTWFNMMDQFWKKSFVVSTLNKLIKYAKKNDPQLTKDLSRWFDDPKIINEIIEDLKEWRMSENVNLFLFTKLADVQPLTRMQMPKTYLSSWNGRIFYQFKTFAIKQLDYMIQKWKRDLQTKWTVQGLWSIVVMMWIIMLCGAWTDEIKDFSMWRRYNSRIWRMINDDWWSVSMLSDRFWDNLLKLTGLTKYSIYQARTQWIKSTIEDLFFSVSWLDILTYPMQDIQDAFSEDWLDFSQASSWQLVPIIWKYGYWRAWAWQTKQQKKLDKEKKSSSWSKSSKKSSSGKGQLSR